MKRLKEIIRFAGYFVLGGIIIMGLIVVFSPDDKEAILDLDNLDITQVSKEKVINVVRYGNFEAGEHKKGRSTGVKGDYADYDYDNCRYSIEKCTGIFTVSSTKVGEAELSIDVSVILYSGELKMFIIRDNEIIEEFVLESGETQIKRNYLSNKSQMYYVKIVANNAAVDIDISRNVT